VFDAGVTTRSPQRKKDKEDCSWPRRRWEGDTLVVDVAPFTGRTWFDRSSNFHGAALQVVVIGVVSVQ
jgi:hypothetical protein